ncbi:hypothetical protein Hanom_Chr17g01585481 [Helianthus anomalus]
MKSGKLRKLLTLIVNLQDGNLLAIRRPSVTHARSNEDIFSKYPVRGWSKLLIPPFVFGNGKIFSQYRFRPVPERHGDWEHFLANEEKYRFPVMETFGWIQQDFPCSSTIGKIEEANSPLELIKC